MLSKDEQKNRRIGVAVSITVHTLIVLLLFIINAWKAPDPPLPEYGIELNFGMTDAGSGDIQPQSEEISEIPPSEVQDILEELIEEESPEEVVEEVTETPPLQNESPDVIPLKTETKPKPVVKPVEEKVKDEPKPKPTINEKAVMGSPTNTNPNTSTSHGDKSVTGDQGVKEGSVDSRALYGEQGGGGNGPLFNLANWQWDKVNIKKDASNENGKIVFKINVDDGGYIIGVSVLETTVSPSVVRYYQNQVEKFTFNYSSSSGGGTPPPQSSGTITLFIRQN